jgi:cytochrome c peroxidase
MRYSLSGHGPDPVSLLNAIAIYEHSLVTPGSAFARWLRGGDKAPSADELKGYALFKSLGCISCHQGVNVGGNLFERSGVFSKLTGPNRGIFRVPSLRNIATTAPHFDDGNADALDAAVGRMAAAQIDQPVTDDQTALIVAFLRTLT